MLKKLISLVIAILIFSPAYAQFDALKGGTSVCKFKGGDKNFKRKAVLRENIVTFNQGTSELDFEFEGDAETNTQEIDYEVDLDLEGINLAGIRPNKNLKTMSRGAELFIQVDGDDESFAIISLANEEDSSYPEATAKLRIKSIKNGKGIGRITYPRTVVLSLADFETLEAEFDKEGSGDVGLINSILGNATENGAMRVTCKFKNVPVIEDTN